MVALAEAWQTPITRALSRWIMMASVFVGPRVLSGQCARAMCLVSSRMLYIFIDEKNPGRKVHNNAWGLNCFKFQCCFNDFQ